jgi:ubiquinone/menaquinone biosynthesis C-methylase UbiE
MNVMHKAAEAYILGYNREEHARLDRQAQALEAPTRMALSQIGVKPGWRCLDVACGTGAVTRILGQMVGPTGAVRGVDIDEAYGARAIAALNEQGPAIHAFQKLDVMSADEPEAAPYDLVFARLLLVHMTNPDLVLRRLWSWVRPGGTLLVLDYDTGVVMGMPQVDDVDFARELLLDSFYKTGKNPRMGAALPYHFQRSGLGVADGNVVMGSIRHSDGMLTAVLKSLEPVIFKLELADRKRMDGVYASLALNDADPISVMRYPDLVATWKVKAA